MLRYCPIVPMVLVNGAEGIATGWSTRVLSHDIREVIDNVRRLIDGGEVEKMVGLTRSIEVVVIMSMYVITDSIILGFFWKNPRVSRESLRNLWKVQDYSVSA